MPPKTLPLPPLATLKPFRSFFFLKHSSPDIAAIRTKDLRDAIADLAKDLAGASLPVRSARSAKGELYSAYAVYRRDRRAAWTTHADFVDVEHQLIAVSGYKN